jgi:trehalose 6-phosphate phosphatase
VLLDFDGTLSSIVDDPDTARPADGVTSALERLAQRYQLVAVVSGRPVAFLRSLVPPGIVLSGLYGLEVVRDGTYTDHPYAGAWREAVEDVVRCSAARGPAGMRVEPKGLSLTLHYRSHPELADEVKAFAASQASRSGLVARSARMSVELHPPIEADKGTAVEQLAGDGDLQAVCYVGDDVGDLPAFDALDRLTSLERPGLRVAVGSDESPPELISRADVVLDGTAAVPGFLAALLGDPDPDS